MPSYHNWKAPSPQNPSELRGPIMKGLRANDSAPVIKSLNMKSNFSLSKNDHSRYGLMNDYSSL